MSHFAVAWQLSGGEVAQRVAVLQRQLEEARVLRRRAVQRLPSCGTEPAPKSHEKRISSCHGTA
jgi:hypothetical protein